MNPPKDWLEHPVIELHSEENGFMSAFVKLREGRPAYTVQPNDECLVFFHLGRDHWPVSIEFLEPIPGRMVFDVIARFVESEGKPVSVGLAPAHEFTPLTHAEIAAIIKAMGAAQQQLEGCAR